MKPSGPAHHQAPHRVRTRDVAVVVDLDPLRRTVEPEALGKRLEERPLGRAFADPPLQRLAGIALRGRHQAALLAAHRPADAHPAPRLHRERLGDERLLGQREVQQDQRRRLPVLVELAEEGGEHSLGRLVRGMAGEERPVAVVPPGAEEEDLHAGLAGRLVDRRHVRILRAPHVDPLAGLDVGECADAVAEGGGGLELEGVGRGRHALGKAALDLVAAAREEGPRLLHQGVVLGLADAPDAGRGAAPDLILEAGPGAPLQHRIGA